MAANETIRRHAEALLRLVRPSAIPALIAGAVIFAGGYVFLQQNRENFRNELNNSVQNELDLLSTRLQGEINTNISALRSFANSLSVDPTMSPAQFNLLAGKLLIQNPQLTRVSTAPNAVIRMTFPLSGNERMIGTDFKRLRSSQIAMNLSQSKAKPILAGPVQLPNGRTGFTIFTPVFVNNHERTFFWGFVEAVIDEQEIYRNARLLPQDDQDSAKARDDRDAVQLAVRDVSLDNSAQDAFFGDTELFSKSPVLRQLRLPGGTWEMAAIPTHGWDQEPANTANIQFTILFTAAMVIAAIVLTGGLVNERQRNMATLRSRDRELITLSHRLNLALDSSHIGVWEIDLDTQERTWDERMHNLHGLAKTKGVPTYTQWLAMLHEDDRQMATRTLFDALDESHDYRSQYRVKLDDGSIRHVRNVGSTYTSVDGRAKLTGITWDVTDDVILTERLRAANAMEEARNIELEQAKDRIEHNALHDPLTGLGNRRMLDTKLGSLRADGSDGVAHVALLHIDLDRFKQINDTLGHAAGDAMLMHAAEILRTNVRDTDMVARIGGDEFVVVIPAPPGKDSLAALSQRIITQMRQPVNYNGFPCRFGVSIGIAIAGEHPIDARKLLVNADIALYRAKENGRSRCEFFTDTLQAEIITTKRIADEILEGIESDQFTAWYQPQFEAGSLRLAGVEALIRWNHPREGLLTPDKFLKIAEELNVVATLDRIVLDRALIDAMRWAALGIEVPKISVNVSAKRLSDEMLLQSLEHLNFTPGQLSFELVESIFLDESDDIVTANIERIKKLGIDIEIDDFGTGHTSIVSLLKIKPKRLKIDRQLVAPILKSRNEQALIRSIIEIGRSLSIETVAEGVETMAHAEMLGLLGCDLLQGYAFAKPLSFDAFVTFATEDALRLAS